MRPFRMAFYGLFCLSNALPDQIGGSTIKKPIKSIIVVQIKRSECLYLKGTVCEIDKIVMAGLVPKFARFKISVFVDKTWVCDVGIQFIAMTGFGASVSRFCMFVLYNAALLSCLRSAESCPFRIVLKAGQLTVTLML